MSADTFSTQEYHKGFMLAAHNKDMFKLGKDFPAENVVKMPQPK